MDEGALNRDFYRLLSPLDSFLEVTDVSRYRPVPDEWSLVVTDVRGSTRAIEEGRYKDVNATGVASIVAAQNALAPFDLPFVFGGDGATLLVPNELVPALLPALRGARVRAAEGFGLELRVGIVRVSELRAAGHEVLLARFSASEFVSFAMFAGDGLTAAEKWVKDPEHGARYAAEDGPSAIDLAGFECRWEPLPSRRGQVASILVHALGTPDEARAVYGEVLERLASLLHDAAPVSRDGLRLGKDGSLHQESALRGGRPGSLGYRLRRAWAGFENGVGRRLMASGTSFAGFDGERYPNQVVQNTDYRKFDDTLRMVLDLTTEELDALESFLTSRERAGQLEFGVHRSAAALMTCIVRKYEGEHVHFVDGAEGGYALAAKRMKARRAGAPPPRRSGSSR